MPSHDFTMKQMRDLTDEELKDLGFEHFEGPVGIAPEQLSRIFPGLDVHKAQPVYTPIIPQYGDLHRDDIVFLSNLVRHLEPEVVFEFGTFGGRTALNLAAAAPNATIYTMDFPRDGTPIPEGRAQVITKYIKNDPKDLEYLGNPLEDNIVQIWQDSRGFDPEDVNGRNLVDSVDLCFVDGDHSYIGCKTDVHHARRMVKNGGLILLHDTYKPGNSGVGVSQVAGDLSIHEGLRVYTLKAGYELESSFAFFINHRGISFNKT